MELTILNGTSETDRLSTLRKYILNKDSFCKQTNTTHEKGEKKMFYSSKLNNIQVQ
jgi:hypothetical protein